TPPPAPQPNVVRATMLRRVATPIWTARQGEHDDVMFSRETYLPLQELLVHWARRAELGAALMPETTGRSVVEIPEQAVWFGGQLDLGQFCMVDIRETWVAISNRAGAVKTMAYDGGPVYYRVDLLRTESGAVGMLQQLVIGDGDRHVVVTGSGAAQVSADKIPQWLQMIRDLPVMPVC
ncbi:MAG TPA: hypothetical protein VD902_21835, partial [Symbiobacteriaceae bacterium]|nr:hypothetical protein [Symbiobacteriaceae bacterium]